eukprot:TRINITY_DN259_c0_g1_i2.p1 TRINITY_DN259_c0_g1~~TRINITY_DN259_c0_g1_i2.p1  ORF type:complete len:671 (-),score=161.87 TRINITY_DN259_c0_g1_i2:23-2035(-)
MLRPTNVVSLVGEINRQSTRYDSDYCSEDYYRLIFESVVLLKSHHTKLQTQLEKAAPERRQAIKADMENCGKHICEQMATLSDHFFKMKRYDTAALCYVHSSRSVADVVALFGSTDVTRPFVISYLNGVLFDPALRCDLTESLSNEIVALYAQHEEDNLPGLILDTWLDNYTKAPALEILEKMKKKYTLAQAPHQPQPRRSEAAESGAGAEAVAKAVLLFRMGHKDQATSALELVDSGFVVRFFAEARHRHFLCNTAFSALLRRADPYALLELTGTLGPDALPPSVLMAQPDQCQTFTFAPPPVEVQEDWLLQMCYLERLLSTQPSVIPVVAQRLAQYYLQMIQVLSQANGGSDVQSPLPPEVMRERHHHSPYFRTWIRQHQRAFTEQPKWLTRLPPFNAVKVVQRHPYATEENEDFDYHFLYLKKLEALLCNKMVADCSGLLDQLNGMLAAAQDDACAASYLSLLSCLMMQTASPKYSAQDALGSMVSSFPQVSLDFGKTFCTKPEEWQVILNTLLSVISSDDLSRFKAAVLLQPQPRARSQSSVAHATAMPQKDTFVDDWVLVDDGKEPSPSPSPSPASPPVITVAPAATDSPLDENARVREVLVTEYRHVLEDLATSLNPEVFIQLLPPDGNMAFFLDYIRMAFHKRMTSGLVSSLLNSCATSCFAK